MRNDHALQCTGCKGISISDAGHTMAWEHPKGLAAAISSAIQSGE